mmetsp:Transcript_17456/g.26899  ORF Transcript_17456/g.26899 Transcript_17456/m.26899 type:complete len:178 (+) Transcript_17456:1512-2045(+)
MDDSFEYFFAINVFCLICRIITILQFNERVGPLFKIVTKLAYDFFNFCIIYIILVIMFSILINLNFLDRIHDYETFFKSFTSIVNASLGNYDFDIFHDPKLPDNLRLFGEMFLIFLLLIFNILISNLIIAILSNVYNTFDERSNGLYLSKILSTRDELNYDRCYGGFLSALPPINFL